MRRWKPGVSVIDDYEYGCDNCENWEVWPVFVWKNEGLRGDGGCNNRHFSICSQCLSDLYFEHVSGIDKSTEDIFVKRAIITEDVRNKIYKRDGRKCVECGATSSLCLDHKIAFSKGGKTDETNLRTLCSHCNMVKRDK